MKKVRFVSAVTAKVLNTYVFFSIPVTENGRHYENKLVLSEVIGRGKTKEVLIIPFEDVIGITYKKPLFVKQCTVFVATKSNNELVAELKVDKISFEKSVVKKMIKIIKKSKK